MQPHKPKEFHLDTSVIIHDPTCLKVFEENDVCLHAVVLEEIDKLKHKERESIAMAARHAIKELDSLTPNSENLQKGVRLPGGGTLRVDYTSGYAFYEDTADNRIVNAAHEALKRNDREGKNTILLSQDNNVRNKGRVLGVKSEPYKHDKTTEYEEYGRIYQSPVQQKGEKSVHYVMENGGIYRHWGNGRRKQVQLPLSICGIRPKNNVQICALDALLDPSINLVVLAGTDGVGKTLLSMAAAFHLRNKRVYDRITATKPYSATKNRTIDKSWPWMRPIWDNMEVLTSANTQASRTTAEPTGTGKRPYDQHKGRQQPGNSQPVDRDMIQIEQLSNLGGACMHNTFCINTEAQSLRRDEIKQFVMCAGKGTKMVIEGNLKVIDRYLDADNTGMAHLIREFITDDEDFCYLQFPDEAIVSSSLAARAAKRL